MKTLFIPVIKEIDDKSKILSVIKKLPSNVVILYSIQYRDFAIEIRNLLGDKDIKFEQILGCSEVKIPKTASSIVVISSGRFYAHSIAAKVNIPVYILENYVIKKIDPKEIAKLKRKQKVSYVNFLNSNEIGVFISLKPGQQNLKRAMDVKKKYDKKFYFFIGDNFNISESENFELKSWVNTACPRIDFDDSRIINLSQI